MKKSTSQLNIEGKKYFEEGQASMAIKCFKEALEIDPKFYEGWFNLGLIYQKQNRFKEAIECFQNNIKYYADNPFAFKNLALCYSLIGDTKKALDIAKVMNGKGDNWESYFNLATTAQIAGDYKESIKNYKKAIELNPSFLLSYGQLYNQYIRICDWNNAKKLLPKINILGAELPYSNVARVEDPQKNLEVIRIKANDIENKAILERVRFTQDRGGMINNKKIRVGYLSSDFHDHATSHLILGLFKNYDRKKFEFVVYSHGVHDDTVYRRMIESNVDAFRDISGLNDKEAAVLIYKDVIDILVDLKGHTNGNRLGIMALKPAPISVTWLGFPGTTGLSAVDYIIADKIVIPKKEQQYYREKVLYMPHTYQVNDNQQEISKKEFAKEDFKLPKKGFIFASFNQSYKITEETFKVWMSILKRVPDSTLWLYEKDKLTTVNLKKAALEYRINPDRLVFATNLPKSEHLARLKLADLTLDTFTYNGHTTTSDSLWAGVPVVTLKGNHFASRVSASLLTAIGLPELITKTQKEYENLAVELALKPKKLLSVRNSLLSNRLKKPLFNSEKFTRDLEDIYQEIYGIYVTPRKKRE